MRRCVGRPKVDRVDGQRGVRTIQAGGERLTEGLRHNEVLWECLRRLPALELPGWYLGAGCIGQTIWNIAHGKAATADIADYDLAYFDADLAPEREVEVAARVGKLLEDLPVRPDVKNQARVHLWHEGRFGYPIRAYASSEDAIATWPTTATAVGVRSVDGILKVYAPFDTADLFALVVRPNRVKITPDIYAAKVARWVERWPSLKILPWEQGVGVSGSRRAV